jgi:alpha-galactosidase
LSQIWHDEAARSWLLRMRSSCYAFGLSEDGTALRHRYWGADLHGGTVPEAAPWAERLTMSLDRPDEYVPWGGLRFDEPSLKAEFADGTRGIEWAYAGQRASRDGAVSTLEIDFADTSYDLLVTLYYRIYDGFDVLERWASLRHTGPAGAAPVVIRQAHSANWWVPARAGWRLRYLHGGWGAETQLTSTTLGPGKVVLESRRGTTSHQLNPWFTLDPDGTAAEESGEVWSGELAWSGSWKIVFEQTPYGRVHASGGVNDFDWAHHLAPGAELVLPPFAALYTGGGFGAASREWHAWQLSHVLPVADRLRPVLYNSWEATSFAVSVAGQSRLAALAAQLGVECFVVDDGWFTGRTSDRAGLGDWSVDRSKFPDGLGPLIASVNQLGMRFGLWVEPEMVNPDSALYREHPDWVYHFAGRTRTQRRNQLVLNLARPDVAAWVFATMDRLLSENNIEFVKWDMNRPFSEPGWPGEINPERLWVDHVRNLYAILDDLRRAHPGVEFESCCGGGGRADLGILRRVEQVWTSDNTDAWDRVRIQQGFSQAYTPQVMAAWVTDSPNFLTGRELPLSFRFHVAMAGALGIGGDLSRWSAAELASAAELVAAYKQIRPIVQRGLLYRVGAWAHCYVAPDGSSAVVLAWWGPGQCSGGAMRSLRLAGLDPDSAYRNAETGESYTGAVLLQDGLRLPAVADSGSGFGSALIRLVRLPLARAVSLRARCGGRSGTSRPAGRRRHRICGR